MPAAFQALRRAANEQLISNWRAMKPATSLSVGLAGALMYCFEDASSGDPDPQLQSLSKVLLEGLVDALACEPSAPSLYGGIVGVAWLFDNYRAQLHALNLSLDISAFLDEVDGLLLEGLCNTWMGPYDLTDGLAGLGLYGLGRGQQTGDFSIAAACLKQLVLMRRIVEGCPLWLIESRHILDENVVRQFPDGQLNLGLAHGIPGLVSFLANAVALGVEEPQTMELLENAVRILRKYRVADSEVSFPGWVGPDAPRRQAWCYGDPGVACALWLAAKATNDVALLDEVKSVVAKCSALPEALTGIADGSLCHGSAGFALLLHLLSINAGEPAWASSACYWVQRALDQFECHGLVRLVPSLPGRVDGHNVSLLSGTPGTVLALGTVFGRYSKRWCKFLGVASLACPAS
ncbi:hypothetical protein C1O66_10625 [Paucibacter aquatile]|uniref:Lantibiotic biosynthesis protein n=1 Tax=Kinneretia aquatilis TaxID=2070761 RepID=A0A2N8KWU5_9BURK|nr:lanthionine synthetase LanC family protein [Paucibacter aquatile]PND37937.1 hypothetical protein C1O66_10625 [Paucibacter aquatile]